MKEKLIFGVYAGAFIYIFILISSIDEAIKFSLKIFIALVVLALGFIYVLYASKKETKALIIGATLGLEVLIFFSKQVSSYFLSLWHDTSLYQETLLVETFLLLISIVFLSYRFTSYKNGEQNNSNNALGNTSFLDSGITIFTKMAETATFFFTSIFLSFVGFYFIFMMFGRFGKEEPCAQDEFATLLEIVLAFISVMGVGIYKWIEKNITKRVEKKLMIEKQFLDQEKDFSSAHDMHGMGYAIWFSGFCTSLGNNDKSGRNLALDKAIMYAKDALEKACYLETLVKNSDKEDSRKESEWYRTRDYKSKSKELLFKCKNNLAFFLSDRANSGDKEKAFELASELISFAKNEHENLSDTIRCVFKSTWALYLYKFSQYERKDDKDDKDDNEEEMKREALGLISEIVSKKKYTLHPDAYEFLKVFWINLLGEELYREKIQ